MKKFFRKIQEFFIHLFGGVTPTYAREKIFELETKWSSQYDELCDKYQASQKELAEVREELEKYKKENTMFSVRYMDEPVTFESKLLYGKFNNPTEENFIKEDLIQKIVSSENFKNSVRFTKEHQIENDCYVYRCRIKMINLSKEIYSSPFFEEVVF